MSTAAPRNRFLCLCNTRLHRLLLGWILPAFLLVTIPAFSQEPPRLLAPQGHLTSVTLPPTVPLTALPSLDESPVLPPIKREELDQIIQEGQAFEAGERWSDALAHYEAALRTYRNHNALMDHYRVARFHCDVGRRFHDSSYLNLVRTLTASESLDFFENVIAQIQREYADTPLWEQLFRHGIQSFSIALADANFRAKVNLNIANDKVSTYLAGVQTTVNGWIIRDKDDMKNGIINIAEGAQKQIGLNPVVVLMEFTCGVIGSLDPNTAYLTPNQLNDQYSAIYGNLVGLGVELRSEKDALLIVRVFPGSPAEESGLKEGDRIVMVDDISLRGRDTDSAADLLQGKEGTMVKLSVISAGLGQRPREVSIIRRYIEVPSVEDVRMIDDKLGYIKLTSFQSKTCVELTRALNDLECRGMKCLILDLRRNPGGLFNIGVEVASMFIEQGAIVRTRGRDRGLDSPCMATPGNTCKVPLIVLIDEESASASEIVAGAIRDHRRGILIGKRSYGKGTIQKIIPIQTGASRNVLSGVKLTIEQFYSPQGWAYSGVGVTPHITIREEEKQRTLLARPLEGRLPLPLPRPVTSNPDDPFIQEAVKVSQSLVK